MTAILVRPLPFTVTSSTGWSSLNPVTNANLDHPGLVARTTGNTASFTVNIGTATSIDTVALIGSTLPSSATITVTATGYSSGSTAAYTGSKDSSISTKSIFLFTPITVSSVTVSITASAPFDIQRVVVGKRIETAGIDQSCEQMFEDQSIIDSGPGFTTVEEFNVLASWKAKMSWISDTKWRDEFVPFFNRVGLKKAVLFVPISDDATRWQHEAVFGRITTLAKGEHNNYDNWIVSFTITALAP